MWEYTVEGYDGEKAYIESGIVCGKNMSEATKELEEYYGQEIATIMIEHLLDGDDKVYVLNTTIQN
jgi:hypothetical protein